jgi:hypothetical protein
MRVALELSVPDGEHRDRLLDALAHLIRRRGFETFVSAPILLPRSEYFPERWERDVTSARRLLRRLMHYAGLGEFGVSLQTWHERPLMLGPVGVQHTGDHAAAWFAGFRDGSFEFGLEKEQLRHEESLVAALGHEVAHAYRDHHGLVIRDRDLEEKLTDLTCVYLGFGAFALTASHSVQTGGMNAAGEKLLYETRSLGYLSPGELALLLGAQLAVRADGEEQRAVCKELLPNHAALVEGALRAFEEELDGLRSRLALPDPSSWPARVQLGPRSALPDDDDDDVERDDAPHELGEGSPRHDVAESADTVAFRVKRHRGIGAGALGAGASALGAMALGLGTFAFYGACALGVMAGVSLGRRLRTDECSGCRRRLPPAEERCPTCGARIAGEISSHDERLEAEERHRGEREELAPDDDHDDRDDPVAILFTAMLAAWALRQGLDGDAPEADQALARRVEERDFDTLGLYTAWLRGLAVSDEIVLFADYYCGDPTAPREQDFAILSTANELDDRPANYARFAAILDRRFAEWKSTRASDV